MSDTTNPFGLEITHADIIENLSFFDDWEERYKYVIELGKQLPVMADELKTEDRLLRGCQSQVWVTMTPSEKVLEFAADSDAHIVRGLLAIVLAAYNHQTPNAILAFDIDTFFDQTGLVKHLSPTRGNGLKAMVEWIRARATEQVTSS